MKLKDWALEIILVLIGIACAVTLIAVFMHANTSVERTNAERQQRAQLGPTYDVIVPSYVTLDCMNGWLVASTRGSLLYVYDEKFQPIRCNNE